VTPAPSRRPYSRHGFHALKRRVAVAGLDAVDRRYAGGRELVAWWEEQIAHLGGRDVITHPELTLVKRAGVLEVLIRQAEAEFLERGVQVGRRRSPRPHPLLPEYRGLVREQREILTQLGLERRAQKVPDLRSYMEDPSKPWNVRARAESEGTPPNGHAEGQDAAGAHDREDAGISEQPAGPETKEGSTWTV
jgi:hypothetical protein